MDKTNTTRRRGRPRRAPEHLRNRSLRVAVSTSELEAISARAQSRGQRLAVYIRRCALIGSPQVTELLDLLGRLLAQLRGLASNINQASHRANLELSKKDTDPATVRAEQAAIAGALGDVRELMGSTRDAVARLTTGAGASITTPPVQPSPFETIAATETQQGQGS